MTPRMRVAGQSTFILAFALIVGVSRFAFLPDGPWEQDEAIFATAVVDFDMPRHRPHPPGFPGWIALGKLVAPVVGDALLALRLISCAASVATFVLLTGLLARVVAWPLALAGALVHATIPTVWFHAPRAFADTTALALAVGAIACFVRANGRRIAAGWVLLAWAGLARPQLAPSLAVVAAWALARHWRGPAIARVGPLVAATVVAVVAAVVVVDSGGWDTAERVTISHFTANARSAAANPAFADLGIVRGLGGVGPTCAWIAASAVGLVVAFRRGRAPAAWLTIAIVATTFALVRFHPPSWPRYSVSVAIACVPALVLAASVLGVRAGVGVLGAAAIAQAVFTFPAVRSVTTRPLPVMAAFRYLAQVEHVPDAPIVHSRGTFSFARWSTASGLLSRPILDAKELAREADGLRGPYDYAGSGFALLPGATVTHVHFDDFPTEAWDLSQRRFHRATVVHGGIAPGRGVGGTELDSRGQPFSWLEPDATLWAQPGATALVLVLAVDAAARPMPLQITVDDTEQPRIEIADDIVVHRVPLACPGACRVGLAFESSRVTASGRELSARLYGAWCEGPELVAGTRRYSWNPARPHQAAAMGVEIDGFHRGERFVSGTRLGAWTNGRARARFPARGGLVRVTLAVPPPRNRTLILRTDAGERTIDAGSRPSTHEITVVGGPEGTFLEIESDAFVPAGRGGRDRRRLGVIVFDVEYVP